VHAKRSWKIARGRVEDVNIELSQSPVADVCDHDELVAFCNKESPLIS